MLLIGCISLLLFSVSLYLFSKSAHIRAKTRTESLYAFQLHQQIQNDFVIGKETDVIINQSKIQDELLETDIVLEVNAELKNELEEQNQKLEAIELDEKAKKFLQKVIRKNEDIITDNYIQDELQWEQIGGINTEAWFNFKEVNLTLSERPENGLYFIAVKIMDKYDDITVITSDGTDERMFEHKKFIELNVGDIFIGQVEVFNRQWRLINAWEINQDLIDTSKEEKKVS